MMNAIRKIFWLLLCSALASLVSAQTDSSAEHPDVIVVTGKLPGPPLWRVAKDDNHVLWIFGYLSPIPKDMEWQSARVEGVLARVQEYLPLPEFDVAISPWVKYNPLNLIRGMSLAKKVRNNPGKQTLATVLPPAMYQRYAALKAKYFARNDDFEQQRPLSAGQNMTRLIQKQEGLAPANDILKKINRLVARNGRIKTTETDIKIKLDGSFRQLADRVEAMSDSISKEQELKCFDWQLTLLETDVDAMKQRANAWAQGFVRDFRDAPPRRSDADPCYQLLFVSSESATVEQVIASARQQWLANAEKALDTNAATLAVLNMAELLNKDGLLAQLRDKGYDIREP